MSRSIRIVATAVAIIARPTLWPTALRLGGSVLKPGARAATSYTRFRLHTNAGEGDMPSPAETVAYLEWVREYRSS